MVAPIHPTLASRISMKLADQTGAILTDAHFLIPLAVFCVGLALLITLR